MDVQRVGVGAADAELVHLAHLQSGHRRPGPHGASTRVGICVCHALPLAVVGDGPRAAVEPDLPCPIRRCAAQISQVAWPRRSHGGQIRSGGGAALVDGQQH